MPSTSSQFWTFNIISLCSSTGPHCSRQTYWPISPLPHFFHWKYLTLHSVFLLRFSSKVPCFKTLTTSSPLLSLHHLFVFSVPTYAYALLRSYCCYHCYPPLNTTLIMVIFSLCPTAFSRKHTFPGGFHHFRPQAACTHNDLFPPLEQFGIRYLPESVGSAHPCLPPTLKTSLIYKFAVWTWEPKGYLFSLLHWFCLWTLAQKKERKKST